MVSGLVFNLQRFCTHDGPGIRSVLFIKGCPLRCKWCSNPESQNFFPELLYNSFKCIKCGTCIEKCPNKAISITENVLAITSSKCDLCGICIENCDAKALEVSGKEMKLEEIIAELTKDRLFYEMSGGGVTLSGGEPLSNIDFTKSILIKLKEEGIHTTVETSGYVETSDLFSVTELVDLFLFDIKHLEGKKHIWGTGRNNDLIIKNLTELALSGVKIIIRLPLIPGYNSDEKSLSLIAEFMKELGLQEIHILPYHRLGSSKYKYLGRDYELNNLEPPKKEEIVRVKNYFSQRIKKVIVH